MTIDPADLNRLTQSAQTAIAAFRGFGETPVAASASQESAPAPDVFGELEQRFSTMIDGLRKQLAKLENSVASALRELVAHYREAAKSAAATSATPPVRTPRAYAGLIQSAAQRHELDPALLSAVVQHESNFDPHAVSKAGAEGLMQLMPDTARELGVHDPFDPAQNVDAGASYLRGLIDRYHGRLDLALAAYNAGSGAVDKYGGVPPYPETRAYVQGILGAYRASALTS